MDGVSSGSIAQSVQALNQILEAASQKTMEQAEKMVKATVEMAVSSEPGKGANIDTMA